ncbi:hypothetical protein JTE90_026248 [Oedothorax gibbosus]|uniref:Uncharacterized protein n=1 Tax=Oedothorax gibbosus TaxID=931172 RepID=A0AAV6U6Q2_9ARAC|nr:hypothetical protein JTE90_026248 [Oedothorax gibbosus]
MGPSLPQKKAKFVVPATQNSQNPNYVFEYHATACRVRFHSNKNMHGQKDHPEKNRSVLGAKHLTPTVLRKAVKHFVVCSWKAPEIQINCQARGRTNR